MKFTQHASRIQIVGGQQVLASDGSSEELQRFYGNLFGRLTKEVKNTGSLTRYVGYRSFPGGKDYLHFFGIEVDGIEDIPEGMIAWDLSDNTWTVWEAQGGQDVIVSQEPINWQWFEQSPSNCKRCTGEFTICSSSRNFWVCANAYVDLHLCAASNDDVYLVDYDPSWPQQFEEIAHWLRDFLGSDIALRVEHYGSTSIPDMPAKPIIDVLVEIPSFEEARKRVVPCLNSKMWEYWWYSAHMIFIKRNTLMGPRTHHIHMAPQGHKLWEGLVFRDYLRSHREQALRYAALKHELATGYREDREGYTQAKTEFVQEVLSKALRCF